MEQVFNEIYLWAIAAAPAITAVVTIICSVIKMIKNAKHSNKVLVERFDKLESSVLDTKELEFWKQEAKHMHAENRELKQKLNQVLTELTKVNHNTEE